MIRRLALPTVPVVALLASLGSACQSPQTSPGGSARSTGAAPEPIVAAPASVRLFKDPAALPVFSLQTLQGQRLSSADFKGKVTIINFWATWCGPCKAEIPSLVELQTEYRDDLVVLGFSVDDTPDKMKPYAAQYKINYPLLVGNGRDDVQDAYGPLWGIPVSVIIDREGNIAKKHSGIASKEQFEQEIKRLL
jgi:thiol-disulfide isomerase/thioredoxin